MKRFAISIVLAAGVTLATWKMVQACDPVVRARCSEMCERMFSQMPESFPPNRMMADLVTVKKQTASILDLLEDRTKSQRCVP